MSSEIGSFVVSLKAKVEGYQVGGKTGTAQHLDKNDGSYLLSFLGFAPMDNPQLVCYAIVDEPDVPDNSSSSYACRLFSAVMSEALPYMNIYAATDTGLPGSDTAAGQTQTQARTDRKLQAYLDSVNADHINPVLISPLLENSIRASGQELALPAFNCLN